MTTCTEHASCIEDAYRAEQDVVNTSKPDVLADSFLFVRHASWCALNAVRDNPPDDPACTCGLGDWFRALRAALTSTED